MTPCYQFFVIKILCSDVSGINCASINFLNSALPYSYISQINHSEATQLTETHCLKHLDKHFIHFTSQILTDASSVLSVWRFHYNLY